MAITERLPTAIDTPFHFDGFGRVAFTRDPAVQAVNRLAGLIDTQYGERVMRPNFGTDARKMVFENRNKGNIGIAMSDIQRAVNLWESETPLLRVSSSIDDSAPERLNLDVAFSIFNEQGEKEVYEAVIEIGGEVVNQ